MKTDSKLQVSVIIPTYHDWQRLSLCLKALDAQSYDKSQFEIVVVNNDPQDLVPEDLVIPSNCTIVSEGKPGSYAARNAGIKLAKGEIVALTDSDCIPDKDWLTKGVSFLLQNHNVGVVAGNIKLFNKSSSPNFVETYEKYTAFKQENNVKVGSCVGANWFSYKAVIEEFGCFDAELKSNGDTVLSRKIYEGGLKIIYCESAVIFHPSRNSFREIGNKYRRIFGGSYQRHQGNKTTFSIRYVLKFIYRRLRFNLKKVVEVPPKESFSLLIVNLYIFFVLTKEAAGLLTGAEAKRL